MTMNGKFKNLLRAEKKPVLTRRNILFYSILGLSVICLIIFCSSIAFADSSDRPITSLTSDDVSSIYPEALLDTYDDRIEADGIAFAGAGTFIVSMPLWSIGFLISSAVGFGSTVLTSSLSRTMLLEDKNWLRIWSKKGKISAHYMFKRVQIQLDTNRISILKIGKKYRIKIPVNEGLNLNRFGFKSRL